MPEPQKEVQHLVIGATLDILDVRLQRSTVPMAPLTVKFFCNTSLKNEVVWELELNPLGGAPYQAFLNIGGQVIDWFSPDDIPSVVLSRAEVLFKEFTKASSDAVS